jgi:ribosome maturation factor RimP
MPFAFENLKGLDRDRLLAVIEPVMTAHRVDGVELIWRTDNRGWVLILTVERSGLTGPGAGVTLDQCTELSRDLSTALDVADVISGAYRLEVGSPGLERKLYRLQDYQRFAGQRARIKLREPMDGNWTLTGALLDVEDDGRISIETDAGIFAVAFEAVASGQLLFDPDLGKGRKTPKGRRPKHPKSQRGQV